MPKQPNVLWICTDQQRFDTIHALGNQCIRTPNLDRLVKEGVAFTRPIPRVLYAPPAARRS